MSVVAVIGSSGALGQRVLERLERDPSIDAVVAIDQRSPPRRFSKAEFFKADIADADLVPLLDGTQVLLNFAWDVGPNGGVSDVPAANLVGLGNLLNAAEQVGVDQVVHLSSATVYGAWPDNPIPLPEDAPIRPNSGFPYAVQKADAEAAMTRWADAHPDVAVTVLRPCVVVSGKSETPLARALGGIRTIRARESSHPVQFLHVDDLAGAVMLAMQKQLSGTYNVAPDGHLRDAVARELAGTPGPNGVPERLLPWLTSAAWQLGLIEAAPAVIPYSEHPWVIANDRLRGEGWEPKYSNEEALVEWEAASQWARITPSKRRAIVTGSLATVGAATLATAATLILRKRKK